MDCRVGHLRSLLAMTSVLSLRGSRSTNLSDGGSVHGFEAFEFGVSQIEVSTVAGSGVCVAEGFGLRPGSKVILGFPKGVGGIE